MKVLSNFCGKEIQIKENTQIALEDGIRQKMVVCEDCFDAWTGTFAQPPQEIQERELL